MVVFLAELTRIWFLVAKTVGLTSEIAQKARIHDFTRPDVPVNTQPTIVAFRWQTRLRLINTNALGSVALHPSICTIAIYSA